MKAYDMIIVGGGPIGLACGIEAEKSGLSYLILEKGCLVNSLYNYPLNMTFFSTSERLEIGGVPFISHGHKPNRFEALEYYRRVCMSWNLNVRLYEEVVGFDQRNNRHVVQTSKGEYHAQVVVLALGFYDLPFLLNVPGENLPKVKHYYDEPHPYFGQRVVVVGASNHVGKPIAVLLMRREATVISCNKYTEQMAELTRRADVLVAAAGVPGLINREMVKPGAIVVDVGVNRVTEPDGRTHTVGDVAFDEVRDVAGWISPVPGGVGPMTVAVLLGNVVDAAERAG